MNAPTSLVTPLEPAAPRASAPVQALAQQSSYPAALGRIEAAVASSCGTQHDANEDAHTTLPGGTGRLFVVADGVGGGAMARLASRELVTQLHEALDGRRPDAGRVGQAVLDADRQIARRIAELTDLPGAATLALCAPLNVFASRWLVAWVGDCRVYRLAPHGTAGIELLTRDETFRHLNEVPPSGGSLDNPARMVGNGATLGASVAEHELARGELLALSSDGVHKYVDADDWARLLRQPVPLARRCEDLIARARANGSADDATVLLVQRSGFALPRLGSMLRRAGS